MGKKNGQRRDEAKIFLKKSPAPKIVITASSDDSPDVDYLDNIKRSNGDASPKVDSKDTSEGDPPLSDQEAQKNWLLALFLLLLYISLVVMTAQLTSSAFNDKQYGNYKAPFFFIWCKITLRVLAFPSVFLIQACIRMCRKQPVAASMLWEHCTKTLRNSAGSISARLLLVKFFPMSVTMLFMQIGWVVGLVYAPASIVTALCSATIAFSYIFSWLVLKNKMLFVKGLFVIVAFMGIGLISYATTIGSMSTAGNGTVDTIAQVFEGNRTDDGEPPVFTTTNFEGSQVFIGVLCGIGAALFYSLHQLTFKLAFTTRDLVQVSFIMSCMSLMISLMYLPVPLIMHWTGYQVLDFARMPFALMLTAWSGSYVSSIAYAYGLALSTPFFMSVAEVLIVAINTVIDAVVRHIHLNTLQIVGTVLVVLAFIFMVMPDKWISVKLRKSGRAAFDNELKNKEPRPETEALRPSTRKS